MMVVMMLMARGTYRGTHTHTTTNICVLSVSANIFRFCAIIYVGHCIQLLRVIYGDGVRDRRFWYVRQVPKLVVVTHHIVIICCNEKCHNDYWLNQDGLRPPISPNILFGFRLQRLIH